MHNAMDRGSFTMPGEAGYEALTLRLARAWGADVIRDSDGTSLSRDILDAGYGVYSTVCVIRQHNDFLLAHPEAQQQTFLCSKPALALCDTLSISPLDGYFQQQFQVNSDADALAYWQVYDRTRNNLVPRDRWRYEDSRVIVSGCEPFHEYTVSFLCYRVWEEINMYNHTTNGWTSEHLRQLDPRNDAAFDYLQGWLEDWCARNPATTVVRFTSLFYNFVWIFGDSERNKNLFCDWASYDFTVSPAALRAFEREYGYALTAEDFINLGRLQATHRPPTAHKRDYMAFIQRFVAKKARALVDIVHRHGKKAYVFYDDSWVGMEPYGEYFSQIGFDGLIKCVFSGFECRLCANVAVPTHEIRLHPYLFPVGLGGLPTFSEGGDPARDAWRYWMSVRRALLRQTVERIGLGGYLHLTEGYPDFCDAIARIADEFRRVKALHGHGAPYTLPCRVAVMTSWGKLRSWTLSGHFHETDGNALIHVLEALSGLPVSVAFIGFDEAAAGALENIDVVINAGRAGDAWSGGDAWRNDALVTALAAFVYRGGAFIGVGEPSAVPGYQTYFRMARVLGVDRDTGARACHGRWRFDVDESLPIAVCESALGEDGRVFLTDGEARVLAKYHDAPQMTVRGFGAGMGVYMSDFRVSSAASRMLLDVLVYACGIRNAPYIAADARVEAAFFPGDGTLAVVNNSDEPVCTTVSVPRGEYPVSLAPREMQTVRLS